MRGGARPDLLGLPPFATTMAATSLSSWTSQTPGSFSTAGGVLRRAEEAPAELRVLLTAATAMETQQVALATADAVDAAGALVGAGVELQAMARDSPQRLLAELRAGAHR